MDYIQDKFRNRNYLRFCDDFPLPDGVEFPPVLRLEGEGLLERRDLLGDLSR